ncbi:hypothetical protein R6Q59_007889 [Mikania micrantha]
MAGVDYSGWGMDFEEWERMEMGPPPPHLYADEQEQEQKHEYEYEREYEHEEEVIMMTTTNVTDVLCGSIKSKNQETYVFDERNKEGGDDFTTKSRKFYNYKIMYHSNVSLEALAMAGTDHVKWGMDLEEWERMDMDPPPQHLYAEEFDDY